MFSIWSNLNSSQSDPKCIQEKLKNQKQSFLSPLNSYYKSQQGDKKDNPKLNKNENDVVKKISNYLNLDQESCAENYLFYKNSPFNHFIISSDLLEKLQVDELFSAHFLQFVNFYYRERYSFLKIVKLIISVTAENSYLNYNDDDKPPQMSVLAEIFSFNDLNQIYKSTVKDYEILCKEIKNFSNKKNLDLTNAENFQEKNFTQLLKELELNLEIILMLTNLVNIDLSKFQEILKLFTTNSIIKYLNTSAVQTISQFALLIDQIINLHSLIVIKSLRLDKATGLSLTNETERFTFEDKNKLLSQDTKAQMNEFIQSFNSNQKSSPIILTWSTLLYNLSIDPELAKVFTTELKSLTNRMFSLSIKENVFVYLLDLLASDIYKNQDLIWYVKQTIYEVLNSVLHSFDENSLGDNLKFIYELTFFCMHKNHVVCEHFWRLCKLPDRDNLTILIFYSLETFPISFSLSLTFFSLIAKTSPELCKQVFEYLSQMDQFCEYLENLSPNEYISSGEEIQLTKPRRLFDTIQLAPGTKGTILSHLASANSNMAHRMILQNQAVNWNVPFNCLDLIQNYLNKINFAASQNNLISDNNIISIIQLIDSLFKYFFDIDDLTESYTYDVYTKYMEMYVSSCLMLFTHLINFESPDSYRLISKLLEFFINISPSIYDKLIRLMQQNNLIGHGGSYNKMNIEELFNNRLNLVKTSGKILFLFKSQDYDLIINYFKFIQCLIKESGNNMEYLSPLCAVLVYVFPEIFKWNNSMINLNIDLSITCLNLLHTVLNTSLVPSFANTEFMRNFTALHSDSVVSIDQFCESVLLNTECSESILNLIYTAYECSQDLNFLNEIKKLDNILIQSISLINRLMFLPDDAKTEDHKLKESIISQSNLYFLLVKSISQQNQVNTTATTFQSSLLNGSTNTSSNEIITKNNQFLLQLNLMMSQTNPYLSKNLTVLNSAAITDNKNELNWFHLLTKLAIYKSNQSLDCLIFSIFKKISQLTPRLFGSLLGPYTQQMHTVILSKLKSEQNGQIISILSDFICSLIENQPGFFQILADLKIEAFKEETKKDSSDLNEKFIEGDQSILKELFELVSKLEKSNKSSEDYCVSLSGVVSIFYTMWSNKKINYMNYCKQKSQFWPLLSSILSIIKKDLSKSDQVKQGDEQFIGSFQEYLEYFGDEYFIGPNANFDSFEQFILDANIKSASYAFKIFSYELFELIYRNYKTIDILGYHSVTGYIPAPFEARRIPGYFSFLFYVPCLELA
ncbi:unnamed protein product [Brachionus calyciflorus]|uniref:Uncharacterized protein n=1 Tax=Brachionus calyciflorus TaxID=104777 RepID=A0A813PBF0_9BILA|nr:unnamed protein product [Brachionus calyciflorus]